MDHKQFVAVGMPGAPPAQPPGYGQLQAEAKDAQTQKARIFQEVIALAKIDLDELHGMHR